MDIISVIGRALTLTVWWFWAVIAGWGLIVLMVTHPQATATVLVVLGVCAVVTTSRMRRSDSEMRARQHDKHMAKYGRPARPWTGPSYHRKYLKP